MYQTLAIVAALTSVVRGQAIGTQKKDSGNAFSYSTCTGTGGKTCTKVTSKIVVDSNWRWLHEAKSGSTTNCYTGNTWDKTLCPDSATCVKNCALEGEDYAATYGAKAADDSLTLSFVTTGPYATNVGSRFYLLDGDDKYKQFKLLDAEFTFDVDVSKLPCGLNGALYFVSMDEDGGKAKYPGSPGPSMGYGYCDAQCARDLKVLGGTSNVDGWVPSKNDKNAGVGGKGSCCAEFDVWEANSVSTAYTAHPCDSNKQTICDGDKCGGTYSSERYAGTCDPDGCDFNSYRQGAKDFFGPGMKVDTTKPITVVTQFIGSPLTEVKRFYVQNGKVIPNSETTVAGTKGNSLNADFCKNVKTAFGDTDYFNKHGGFSKMSEALGAGMTLVMSLWDDHYANMLWLDSTYPTDKTGPGTERGSCEKTSGVPAEVEGASASASVTYSNIKYGPIGSTFDASGVSKSRKRSVY